jgi:hypothetical protein
MPKTQITNLERSTPDFLDKNLPLHMIELEKKMFFIKNILGAKKKINEASKY